MYRRRLLAIVLALVVASFNLVIPAASAALPCGVGVVCEAELGTLRGGAGVNTNHAGYSGAGFVDKMNTGAGITVNAFTQTAGTYDVTIRYANDLGALGRGTRTLTLNAAGTAQQVTFPVTGSWATWSTVT